MNKLKKVGLTALATTLVASSAYAGEMSASGSATLNYSGLSTASDANPWTMGNSVTFSGGGDLDNGMTVNVSFELDDDVMDDYSMKLGLGDGNGTLTFSGDSVNAGGVDTVKDIVPTAYTAVYENTNTVDNGLATTSGRNTTGMFGYANSFGGIDVSLGYNMKNSSIGQGDESSIGLTMADSLMDGLTLVAGRFDDEGVAENDTYGVKFTSGSVTAAIQMTDVDYEATGTNDQEATHYGVSLAVNENLSISAGRQEVEIDTKAHDEVNSGFSASYTMGSITIGAAMNQVDHVGGAAASDAEVTSLNIAFAF
ncbi:porin [Candidatus Pelagibacter sp.]|nr:porin [Candidatus Pelagibacter sp.]